ncbi:MAG: ShlB/FhaC/HecB family hemolysin secretion/activation protein [Phenylobacterium sp.]|nr:MAG: ShlB/FhaC/HecB family hemolysin secretion/activation protein [Phenylobacterium sp.]
MKKLSLLTAALLVAGPTALAQPIVSGGAQIQQIPPAPAPPRSLPDIRIERGQPPPATEPAGPKMVVGSLRVTGETRFSEAELIAASGFRPGAELDLAGLRALAARITDFYNRHGYFVAQAYVPAQDIANGAVTIAVIEGHYGKVALDNRSRASDRVARGILAGLDPGDLVVTPPLERRLLLLSDLPGVGVKSVLSPGAAVGTSDLTVDLLPGPRVDGSLEADNAGNRYTGEYRAGATVNFNEPLGIGDVASLRVLTSGSGLNYARASYQAQVQDGIVGVAYAHLNYRLGREFADLHASGTVDIASLYGSYPLIRSRDTNLYALADLDYRSYTDKVGSTSSVTDKSAVVAVLGLSGDHHDGLWGGGWNSYSLSWSIGDLDIKTPEVRAIDAITARTEGDYDKLAFEVSRLQETGGPLSFWGEARGQLASKNLDSSEKMELGGAYGVRGYPEGEAYGDEGYILTAEARLRMARLSQWTRGQVQTFVFVDDGSVRLNKSPWVAGPNTRTLSAAGVGVSWANAHGLMIKVTYAARLGSERATSAPDRSGRVWVQVTQYF